MINKACMSGKLSSRVLSFLPSSKMRDCSFERSDDGEILRFCRLRRFLLLLGIIVVGKSAISRNKIILNGGGSEEEETPRHGDCA